RRRVGNVAGDGGRAGQGARPRAPQPAADGRPAARAQEGRHQLQGRGWRGRLLRRSHGGDRRRRRGRLRAARQRALAVGDGAPRKQGLALFETSILVRFGDLDAAGIAYYPRLVNFLPVAFEDFFAGYIGKTYPLVFKEGFGFPSVKIEIEFLSPVHYGEHVKMAV